ncbi:hypothetical protein ACFS5L_43665 [Streptomyces phyllanthi]|uniref:Uncharacterized protein n=1 Tax=Streptomyces phyllanthi TaxID=1803180 RepID=A0A5N8W1A2_9ACTN|nr:hypothetical protein [Streptomyces phyllanthi]MPY39945.1 hypothetical protein [Streptomyces phyllanthi]
MAHTFEELVGMQRAADDAHARVEALRERFGPPTAHEWTQAQTDTYETAWRAWRDLARDVQAAVTEWAKGEGKSRGEVEADVKRAVRHAGPGTGDGEA